MKKNICCVCINTYPPEMLEMNRELLLPVCHYCKGTEEEKKKVTDYLDSLAEGFICGCI